MGYLTAPETDELRLPSNDTYWVRMKKRAQYGDNRAAQSAMLQFSTGGPQSNGNGASPQMVTDVEVGAYMGTLAVRLITAWNLTDEAENPLPITLDNLDRLDPEDGEFLATEAQKRVGGRAPEKQAPFQKPSGQRLTDTKSKTPKLIN